MQPNIHSVPNVNFFFLLFKNRFILETDHQTYITCYCGSKSTEQTLDQIWSGLMPILDHFEEMFISLAPSKFTFDMKTIES